MAELPGLDRLACVTRLLGRAFPGLRRPENGIILDKVDRRQEGLSWTEVEDLVAMTCLSLCGMTAKLRG
jgi:hypothetical protein